MKKAEQSESREQPRQAGCCGTASAKSGPGKWRLCQLIKERTERAQDRALDTRGGASAVSNLDPRVGKMKDPRRPGMLWKLPWGHCR